MARLPIQGGDDGVWGTVLNDFLLVEHNANGTLRASGSLASKADNSTVVHLAGTETVTGDKNFTGTLQHNGSAVVDTTDVRLTDQVGLYPPQAYGFFAMTQCPRVCDGESTIQGGFITRMFIPAGQAITTIAAYVYTAGTVGGGGNNGFAIYDDDGVLIDSILSESIWTSSGWVSANFSTPIAAQSSGYFIYAAVMSNGYSSAPHIYYAVRSGNHVLGGLGMNANKRHNMFNIGMSSFPASFDPNGYATTESYMPVIGLA
ncbi:MAG: hypothetical protein PVI21_00545 [Candidatus Woesebacteria bacterium]|jgi:hypothetical protein